MRFTSLTHPVLAIVCAIALLSTYTPLIAQSDLPENKKSVLAFDIQLKALRESKIFADGGLDEMIQAGGQFPVDPQSLDRIFGAVSAPPGIDALQSMEEGKEVPVEAFIQMHFNDTESADALFNQISADSQIETRGGKEYLRPKNGGPGNLVAHKLKDNVIEFGTDGYIFQQSRNFFTANLNEAWSKNPKTAIRIAIDMDGMRDLIDEATAMGKQQVPPIFSAFLNLPASVSTLRLAIDLDAQNLIELVLESPDEDAATTLGEGVNAGLGMLSGMGKSALAQAEGQAPASTKVAKQILDALKAKTNGTSVSLTIPRPEGLDEAVKEAMTDAKAAAGSSRGMNRYKQYALSVHNYHDTFRVFPWAADEAHYSKDLSWRVLVLPFLEEQVLYDQLNVKEGWDGDTNKMFAEQMPAIYGEDGATTDVCRVVSAKGDTKTFADIRDGTSNTIMFIQNSKKVPWMKPGDISVDEALELFADLPDGEKIIVGFYDGSVQMLDNSIPADSLRNLLEPNDGNVVERPFN
jgi:hypothetical protein